MNLSLQLEPAISARAGIWVGPANAPENLKAWKPAGSFTRAPDDKVIEAYAVSPNGDLLAYVSSFPIYSVVVKSYKQRRIVQTLKLQDPGTEADVLGFATDDRLLSARGSSLLTTIDDSNRQV